MKSFAIKFHNGYYFITSADNPGSVFNYFRERGDNPIVIESIIENAEAYHEWALFREYLMTYGIEHVRCASYPNWILTDVQRNTLQEFIKSWGIERNKVQSTMDSDESMDKLTGQLNKFIIDKPCLRCGGDGHRHRECFASHDINNELIVDADCYSDFEKD